MISKLYIGLAGAALAVTVLSGAYMLGRSHGRAACLLAAEREARETEREFALEADRQLQALTEDENELDRIAEQALLDSIGLPHGDRPCLDAERLRLLDRF